MHRSSRQKPLGTGFAYQLVYKFGCFKIVQISLPSSAGAPASASHSQAWLYRPEQDLAASASAGALAGLTYAVKDNIDVAQWPTTAGCPAFEHTPSVHATVVLRLHQSGAALLGKTNLDQFACGLNGTRSPYGAVPNAFNPAYVSGGSSSGSAYVVATGQVDFSLGTDTAGSGRVPAGLNNIVGLKPSRGLISTRGVLPAAQSVDCVSIFAGTVGSAVKVLQQAMGFDASDPYSRALQLKSEPLPAQFKFGIPSQLEFFGDALAEQAFAQAITRLRSLGGTAVKIDYTPLAKAASLLYESALVAERYTAIREFFDAHEADVMEPVRSIIAKGRSYSAADLYEAQLELKRLEQAARPMWDGIDVLVVPTAPTHYTIAQMKADPVVLNRNLGFYTNFVNLLDYAALSVPSSLRADGLPFGITLIGPCASDLQLAQLGQRYHHATGLTMGATGQPLPDSQPIAGMQAPASVRVAVVGAHLSGMPLNSQLTERGARLVCEAKTTSSYQFFALPGTTPPKPGLLRVANGAGSQIALEVWDMPAQHYGSFVAMIPSPLGIGSIELADGSSVQGFLCEAQSVQGAVDISHLGGWRAYIASLNSKK
jgi:allophanate hydrolase